MTIPLADPNFSRMSNPTAYELERIEDGQNLTFTFLSDRRTQIEKAIRYTRLEIAAERPIYNLGFGNYDPQTLDISDEVIDNNGDAYIVLGTVLSSIPAFFEFNPRAGILVRGSDSHPDFPEKCRPTCRKKCTVACRNAGRRIRTYCRYVSNNHDAIVAEYDVYGIAPEGLANVAEPFMRNSLYEAILLYRREQPNFVR